MVNSLAWSTRLHGNRAGNFESTRIEVNHQMTTMVETCVTFPSPPHYIMITKRPGVDHYYSFWLVAIFLQYRHQSSQLVQRKLPKMPTSLKVYIITGNEI